MTISEHLLAIAEELERHITEYRVNDWYRIANEIEIGLCASECVEDDIAAFRRAAELAQEQKP